MAIQVNAHEAVCWANAGGAPDSRTRDAYKWARVDPMWCAQVNHDPSVIAAEGWRHLDPQGAWKRIRSVDTAGRYLTERVPQGAQFGTPLTGLRPANLRTSVKVMYGNGYEGYAKIAQGAGHDITADNSYERYMLNTKGFGEGWIPVGSCPVVMLMTGTLRPDKVQSREVKEAAVPCSHDRLGLRNPPCPHYITEQETRQAAHASRTMAQAEAQKSEEAKLLEGQVKVQEQTAHALVDAVKGITKTVADLQEKANAAGREKK